MILNDENLHQLIKTGMIKNICDISIQLTPNGIDLTLKKVEKFTDKGQIDFTNEQRKLPTTQEIPFTNDWVHLDKGCYKVTFNEIVTIPQDAIALARPRSSLLRSGATIESAVWDAGFHGVSISLLVVYNSYGISLQKNARLIQLFFIKMSHKARKTYQGIYQED
ncbi:MAG: deoxyuridine 5'-triphosphate nucleotidohydrolase [Theionarchaea archaeon]|nr:MAG: deoxyuridine 5'-triphosphate nucleotidohydrolase [Theionarchaea archaeon DG-70-1]MBU7028600.1 deoxyuridine 5'-triphosphate nucleotidohydrolase [Theionarchaea archaeon]